MTQQVGRFEIRPVWPGEYETLGELTVSAYHAIAGDMPPQDSYDGVLRDVATRAATSCVVVAVAPSGQLLGGATYVTGPADPYSEHLRDGEAGMRMLAVHPKRQRRGVGRALTRWCLERARAEGRIRFVLHTGNFMPAAVALYESMGFRREPGLDFTPVPGVDLVAYVFEISAG